MGVSDTICAARSVDFDAAVLGLPAPVCEGVDVLLLCCWYLVVAKLRVKPRYPTRDALELTARSERIEYMSCCLPSCSLAVVVVVVVVVELRSDVEVELDIT